MAHCVHCTDDELARMAETENVGRALPEQPAVSRQRHHAVAAHPRLRCQCRGIGTDLAAGDGWFIPRVLNAAFKVHISEPGGTDVALHPAQLLHLATVAGARALDLEDRIGNFDPGREADMVIIDPGPV